MKSNFKCLMGPVLTHNTNCIITVAPAEVLVNNFIIPYYNPSKDIGYQREPSKTRIKKLAKKLLERDADLPTLIVANIRNIDAQDHILKGEFKYNPDLHGKLFIADGQHRLMALKLAMDEATENQDETNLKRLKEKLIPTLISFTSNNELVEMSTFYSINREAKNVPINDAAMIMHRRYKMGDEEIMEELDIKGETWRAVAGDVAKKLNHECPVWGNRIKSPGQKIPAPNITFAAMVNHLKPFVTSPDLEGRGINFITEVVSSYWCSIESKHPGMFTQERAKTFAIQTSSATEVINKIWDHVRAKIQNSANLENKELNKKECYLEIMGTLIENCQGKNGLNDEVSGLDYWLKGKQGCAGMYTSNSAKSTCATYLKGLLSDINV